jgi:hypothetical protein
MGKNPSLREITKSALMLGMIAVLSAVEGMMPSVKNVPERVAAAGGEAPGAMRLEP